MQVPTNTLFTGAASFRASSASASEVSGSSPDEVILGNGKSEHEVDLRTLARLATMIEADHLNMATGSETETPDPQAVSQGRAVLDDIVSLAGQSGIEPLYSPEEMGGLRTSYASQQGYELTFDYDTPTKFATPEGHYTLGTWAGGDPNRFRELLDERFEVEVAVAARPSYVTTHAPTGPVLRLTPR